MYGERVEIAPWYAACEIVLLTSEFEGLPYVAFRGDGDGHAARRPRSPWAT